MTDKVYSFATVQSIVEAYAEGVLLLMETPSLLIHAFVRLTTDEERKAAVECMKTSEFKLWADRTPEEWALPRVQRPKRKCIGTKPWFAEVTEYLKEMPPDGDDARWMGIFQIKGYPPRDKDGNVQEGFGDNRPMSEYEANDRAEFRRGVMLLRRLL